MIGRQNRRSWLGRVVKLATFILLLAGAAGLGYLIYSWLDDTPPPTIVGWRAVAVGFAGYGAPGFADGPAANARFADLFGVVADRAGNIYVADAGHNNRIRKLTPEGQVSTLAGGKEGLVDGPGATAAFNTPSGLAVDAAGNIYVADTGNNAIRKISPEGVVTTLAGDGTPGYRDAPGRAAQFNGPLGVAVDARGNIYVADTYNDRIRLIAPDGQVKTLAGADTPGYQDGPAAEARFDTPCALAVTSSGDVFIADTGNNLIRKLAADGQVSTFAGTLADESGPPLMTEPVGLALTHDGFLYVTEHEGGRISQISPDGVIRILAGGGSGFANGDGLAARFNRPNGIAVGRGALFVTDTANYVVRKLAPAGEEAGVAQSANAEVLPRLTPESLSVTTFPWPVGPQQQWHEVAGTMGEVRGSYDGEARHHFHSGIDVQGAEGAPVLAVYDEKVSSPLSVWGVDGLNEGIQVGVITYVHLRVGRDNKNKLLDPARFNLIADEQGKPLRVRVKRGARFRVGDTLGTVNRMYHVHMNFGPWGAEINPLTLPLVGFSDKVAPTIERDGITILDQLGQPLKEKRAGRLIVRGDVSIVVDAYDQVDGNLARRRLGLYRLGYQVLRSDGSPAPGFEQPRVTMEFNRLTPDREAVKIAYADSSGITVYGNAATKFLYVVTNTIRDGRAREGLWRTGELPPGDYTLRILAADYSGNEAMAGRDLPITIER